MLAATLQTAGRPLPFHPERLTGPRIRSHDAEGLRRRVLHASIIGHNTGDTMSTLVGTCLNGRYRLDAQIGAGGMSTVYRAFDTTLERRSR